MSIQVGFATGRLYCFAVVLNRWFANLYWFQNSKFLLALASYEFATLKK
jgi:hypothetical protein